MSILVNRENRVLVQGLTGREGRFHAEQMMVTPGRGARMSSAFRFSTPALKQSPKPERTRALFLCRPWLQPTRPARPLLRA